MISRAHLSEVIGERTLETSDSKELAREVAAYLLDTNRTADLDSLLRDIMEYRAIHGVIDAEAVSAHEIAESTIKDIIKIIEAEYPKATTVQVERRVDPSVIGGIRVDMANEQLDLTVRDQLDTFKRLTANIKE